jgi:hypothetical protein
MDTPSNITDSLDQADEEILNYTASDDALEAAAGTERAVYTNTGFQCWLFCF